MNKEKTKKFDQVYNYFKEMDSFTLCTLKAHFITEIRLNSAINQFVCNPDFLKDPRLNFRQKINLLRSISLENQENDSWDIMRLLNKIRNKVAHNQIDETKSELMGKLEGLMNKEWETLGNMQERMSDEDKIMATTYKLIHFFNDLDKEIEKHNFRAQ